MADFEKLKKSILDNGEARSEGVAQAMAEERMKTRTPAEEPKDKKAAIDCIAGSFVTSYKAEAISHFYRQGDQLITVIKPEYIGKGKLQYQSPRRITREEYLNKFKFET